MFFNKINKLIKNKIKSHINFSINKLILNTPLNIKGIIVLNFHRIVPDDNINNELKTKISENFFYNYIFNLYNNYDIITPNNFLKKNYKFLPNEKFKILITFDDGYNDNFSIALPILKKFNIKPIFFICPEFISSKNKLWDENLLDIIKFELEREDHIDFLKYKINKGNIEQKMHNIIFDLKYLDHLERQKIIKNKFNSINIKYEKKDVCMSWDEIKKISDQGMEIGSHSNYHSSLMKLNFNSLKKEVIESKKIIENKINKKCIFFAFPYGSKNDYNINLVKYLMKLDFKKCFINHGIYNNFNSNNFIINRISLTNEYSYDNLIKLF